MYKLTYFDMEGRGEVARLIFSAAKVKFVDNRVKGQDWPALKGTLEWGQLPLLHVGDRVLTQSKTIYRYLARKFKLTGADEWEASKCDELVDAAADIGEAWVDFVFIEKDEAKKQEKQKTFTTVTIPTFLGRINKILMENDGHWLVGKNMTWADIFVAQYLKQMTDGTAVNGYPHVRKMQEAVFAQDGIKEYLKTRG